MKFLIEEIKNLEQKITITISSKDIENFVQLELINISKKTNINGFRKGKTPTYILNKHYEYDVRKNILAQRMKYVFLEIMKQKNINIASIKKIIPQKYNKNNNYTYCIEFEIYPKINVKMFKFDTITNLVIKETNEDILVIWNTLKNKQNRWKDANRNNIVFGDLVTIDYKLILNNLQINKYKKNNHSFIVGENQIIYEIENFLLIRGKLNKKHEIQIKFSDIHPEKELQGKEVTIIIIIKKIKTSNIKIQKINNYDMKTNKKISNNKIYTIIQKQIQKKSKFISKNYLKYQIIQNLLKNNPIKIPSGIFTKEKNNVYNDMISNHRKNRLNILTPYNQENFLKTIKNKIRINLLFQKIIKMYSIKINFDRAKSLIQDISSTYDYPNKIIKLYYSNKKLMNKIYELTLEEQVIDILIKQNTIINKKCSFQEAINITKKTNIFF